LCGMDSFSDSTLKKNAHVNARRAPEVCEDRTPRRQAEMPPCNGAISALLIGYHGETHSSREESLRRLVFHFDRVHSGVVHVRHQRDKQLALRVGVKSVKGLLHSVAASGFPGKV